MFINIILLHKAERNKDLKNDSYTTRYLASHMNYYLSKFFKMK